MHFLAFTPSDLLERRRRLQRAVLVHRCADAQLPCAVCAVRVVPHLAGLLQSLVARLPGVSRPLRLLLGSLHLHATGARRVRAARRPVPDARLQQHR